MTGSFAPLSKRVVRALAMLTATAAEVGVAASIVVNPAELTDALLVHVAIVGGLVLILLPTARRDGSLARGELFFLLVTALLGPVGACGALLAMAYVRGVAGRVTPFTAWYSALFDTADLGLARGLRRHLLREERGAAEGGGVASFADVMASGSIEQKQAVVALIASNFQPAYSQPLLAAMNDAEPTVRVMAATAAARIEGQFLASSMALEELRSRDVENVGRSFELARHYDDYANTGLLDAGRMLAARTRALELYRHCDQKRRGDVVISNAIIRLLVRLGREDEAIRKFAPLVTNGTAAVESFVWYVECLYRMGRFDVLRKACRRFELRASDKSVMPERCRQVVKLWAEGSHGP